MKPCCGIAPVVIKGDGKSYCSECDSMSGNTDFNLLLNELDSWQLTSGAHPTDTDKKCFCGSESVGSNRHSNYCPKFEKN